MTEARKARVTTRTLRRYLAKAGPFKVESHADGHFRIYPEWSAYARVSRAWKRDGTPAEDDGGGPGVLDRMGFAEMLEEWLNG